MYGVCIVLCMIFTIIKVNIPLHMFPLSLSCLILCYNSQLLDHLAGRTCHVTHVCMYVHVLCLKGIYISSLLRVVGA